MSVVGLELECPIIIFFFLLISWKNLNVQHEENDKMSWLFKIL